MTQTEIMKAETRELIKAERRCYDYSYIAEVIQRGRICPAKYKHKLIISQDLYDELRGELVVDPIDYIIDEAAFFEFKKDEAIISFVNLYHAEDMHRRIDHYLITKLTGSYPVKRTCFSKL